MLKVAIVGARGGVVATWVGICVRSGSATREVGVGVGPDVEVAVELEVEVEVGGGVGGWTGGGGVGGWTAGGGLGCCGRVLLCSYSRLQSGSPQMRVVVASPIDIQNAVTAIQRMR